MELVQQTFVQMKEHLEATVEELVVIEALVWFLACY